MTLDDTIVFVLIMGIVTLAAAMGGIAILGAWLLLYFGSSVPVAGDIEIPGVNAAPGAATAMAEPAEEGGKLDEWEANRPNRAA